jgi:hypothetical protein
LFLFCLYAAPAALAAGAEYRLTTAFDLAHGRVLGDAEILPAHPGRMVVPRGDLVFESVEADGKPIALAQAVREDLVVFVRHRLRIRYRADFPQEGEEQISSHGIVLSGEWYPMVPGRFRYRLKTRLPSGWEAVSEANRIHRRVVAGGVEFSFDFPVRLPEEEGISLAASDRFVVKRSRYRGIDLYAYFLPEDAARAERFLAQAAEYLKRFERLLGPYPYRRLAIVEHPPAWAHSMPTYIMLGSGEIRADRWEDTALDHEIAHQWLGNSVFNDYGGGNWNEGLALYVADYLSAERAGEGWKCRRRMLAGYGNNMTDAKTYPLVRFQENENRASRFIGYAKAGMVFHMLRRELGDARFFAGLKRFVANNRFRVASWKDIERAFSPPGDRSLSRFFAQWLHRADTPVLTLSGVHASAVPQGYRLEFTLQQSTPPYDLQVPVSIRFTDGSSVRQTIRLDQAALTVRRTLARRPQEVVVDVDFDLFRALAESEYPPTIERLLTRKTIGIVANTAGEKRYAPLVASLAELQSRVMAAQTDNAAPGFAGHRPSGWRGRQQNGHRTWQALNPAALADESGSRPASIVVLGRDNPAAKQLFPGRVLPPADFVMTVVPHPHDPGRLAAWVQADSEDAVRTAVDVLPDLWCLSTVAMKDGRVILREEADWPQGIRAKVR